MGKIDELRKKFGVADAPIQPVFGPRPSLGPNQHKSEQLRKIETQFTAGLEKEINFYRSKVAPSPLFSVLAAKDFSTIDPIEFEKLTLVIFAAFGFKGNITPHSGDHGIDLLLENRIGKIFCVQCKRYNSDQYVSPKEIREFVGAMTYVHAIEGYFVTTSSFSTQCFEFAQKLPLHLIDKIVLNRLILSAETIYRESKKEIGISAEETINQFLSR